METGNPYVQQHKGMIQSNLHGDMQQFIRERILKLRAIQNINDQETPQGKNYNDDVRKLPNGAGWLFVREAFFKVIDMFKTLSPTLILICHVKDAMINKDGKELSEMSIDLSGKTARLVAADADAIGFLYRVKNQTVLNFNGGGDFIVEARQPHLRGQEIVVAQSDEDNRITTFWDRVFLPDND